MPTSTFDMTAASAVLKQRYTRKKLNTLAYNNNTLLALMPKDETLGSNAYVFGVRDAVAQTRSWGSFGQSQASASNPGGASTYNRFVVPHYNDYTTANISGDAIDSAKGDENTLINVLTGEIDGALYTASRSLAIAMYKNGGGARGQISSTSDVTTATITLANVTDITNFEIGMPIQIASTDGTSGSARSGQLYVSAVDRDLGTITAASSLANVGTVTTANWNTISGAHTGDYIFQLGDFGNAMVGLAGWVPQVAPTIGNPFYGVDRAPDATRLAGVRYSTGAGGPIEETLIEAAARLVREGSEPDYVTLNPLNYSQLVKALGPKVRYDRAKAIDDPDIGFEAVTLIGPKGPIKVVADVNQPYGIAYMLKMDTWKLRSIGKAPRIIDLDEVSMLRINNADAYEVRIVSRVCITCDAPGWNAVITL